MRNFKIRSRKRTAVLPPENQPRRFEQLYSSDNATKALFDHVRNMTMSGATLAAAVWAWNAKHRAASPPLIAVSSVVLFVLALFLFAVNSKNGIKKLKSVNFDTVSYWLIVTFYAFAHGTLVIYLLENKLGK